MSAMISKELRREVLADAKRNNARTVASVKQMYTKRIERAMHRGVLTAAKGAELRGKVDARVEELVAL